MRPFIRRLKCNKLTQKMLERPCLSVTTFVYILIGWRDWRDWRHEAIDLDVIDPHSDWIADDEESMFSNETIDFLRGRQ